MGRHRAQDVSNSGSALKHEAPRENRNRDKHGDRVLHGKENVRWGSLSASMLPLQLCDREASASKIFVAHLP